MKKLKPWQVLLICLVLRACFDYFAECKRATSIIDTTSCYSRAHLKISHHSFRVIWRVRLLGRQSNHFLETNRCPVLSQKTEITQVILKWMRVSHFKHRIYNKNYCACNEELCHHKMYAEHEKLSFKKGAFGVCSAALKLSQCAKKFHSQAPALLLATST